MAAVEISFATTVLPRDVRGRATQMRLRTQTDCTVDISLTNIMLRQDAKGGHQNVGP